MSHRKTFYFRVYAPADDIDEVYRGVNKALEDLSDRGVENSMDSDVEDADEAWGEAEECDHAWRLHKSGRICVLCLIIQEGKSPSD